MILISRPGFNQGIVAKRTRPMGRDVSMAILVTLCSAFLDRSDWGFASGAFLKQGASSEKVGRSLRQFCLVFGTISSDLQLEL